MVFVMIDLDAIPTSVLVSPVNRSAFSCSAWRRYRKGRLPQRSGQDSVRGRVRLAQANVSNRAAIYKTGVRSQHAHR